MDTESYWKSRGKSYLNEFSWHNHITRYRFWKQERAIREVLPRDVKTVLEIGCGFGRITNILLESPSIEKIIATDISEDQIEIAKSKIKDPRVEFVVLNALDLNFYKEFDLVIASEVLMHIPPDKIEQVIKNMERASRKYAMNIDWCAPNEPSMVGGYCWQYDYLSLYGLARIMKRIGRQVIFKAVV